MSDSSQSSPCHSLSRKSPYDKCPLKKTNSNDQRKKIKDAPVEISIDDDYLEFTPAEKARYIFLKLWALIPKENFWIADENVE
jgi:hypothetical protein